MQTTGSGSGHEERSKLSPGLDSDVSDLYPMRVLLVDDGGDTPGILEHLSDGIGAGRYIVTRASTIADGYGEMVNEAHDVYIVDHHIGARTGFDLLARANAEGLQLPIVFVAAEGDHRSGVTAVGAGASCYVVKDTADAALLDHCLRHAVEQRRALSRLTAAGVSIGGGAPTKAQILSHIAGRMRAPAAALLEAARHSMGPDLPGHVLESFAQIEGNALALLTLANDLADLSSLESGRLEFDTAPFNLRALISNVEKMIASSTDSPNATLECEVAADVPDSVIGDPGRLRLVIERFIENVAGRCSTDRILLRVRAEDRGPETVTLQFHIQAVDPSPTPQGKAGTDQDTDGIGSAPSPSQHRGVLGMPVALETVSRMGGRVAVDDGPDHHSSISFVVRLQVRETEAVRRPAAEKPATSERPILIVADSIDDRRSFVKTLAEAGLPYVVISKVSEWIASNQTATQTGALPSLAVIASTDDSFDTCDQLTELAPKAIPMVVVTRSGQRGDAARCRERGVKGYLSEPMEPSDLVDVVRAVLSLVESGDTSILVTRHWLREGIRSLRVLVTDDSYTSRFLITRMLEHRGHSTTTACDGGEAIDVLEQDTVDVVLMDVMMPVMDGLEATRRIRAMHNGSGRGPLIIGMSAITDQASRDRCRAAGMDDFLSKPVRPDELFAVIEREKVSEKT
ncbi:MAG TPA: response regulator [Acidimicrobiia bacterium]|nr:response regulator [Acidimicrobiia bacterium]